MGADPVACAALAGGARAKALLRAQGAKAHGLQRRIEGPPLDPEDRCVVVEDVVTTGGSTLAAIEALQRGRAARSAAWSACSTGSPAAARRSSGPRARPTCALSTIDDIYPERPDREAG